MKFSRNRSACTVLKKEHSTPVITFILRFHEQTFSLHRKPPFSYLSQMSGSMGRKLVCQKPVVSADSGCWSIGRCWLLPISGVMQEPNFFSGVSSERPRQSTQARKCQLTLCRAWSSSKGWFVNRFASLATIVQHEHNVIPKLHWQTRFQRGAEFSGVVSCLLMRQRNLPNFWFTWINETVWCLLPFALMPLTTNETYSPTPCDSAQLHWRHAMASSRLHYRV